MIFSKITMLLFGVYQFRGEKKQRLLSRCMPLVLHELQKTRYRCSVCARRGSPAEAQLLYLRRRPPLQQQQQLLTQFWQQIPSLTPFTRAPFPSFPFVLLTPPLYFSYLHLTGFCPLSPIISISWSSPEGDPNQQQSHNCFPFHL